MRRRTYKGEENPFYGKRHTKETIEKIRLINLGRQSPMKGKRFSEEKRKNMGRKKGSIAWNTGKSYEDTYTIEKIKELKDKLSKTHTGKVLSYRHRQILSEHNKGKIWNDERNKKVSYAKLGDKNPSKRFIVRKKISAVKQGITLEEWKGFVSDKQYDELFYCKLFKLKIKRRDKYECKVCGNKDNRNIIHHIDGNKKNTSEENCITICKKCHNKIHGKDFKNWITKLNELFIKDNSSPQQVEESPCQEKL